MEQPVVTSTATHQFPTSVRPLAAAFRTEPGPRQRESWYRTLAEAAHDSIYIVNNRGEIVYANAVSLERFGKRSTDVADRAKLSSVFPPATAATMWRELAQVFATGKRHRFETRFDTPSGELWLETWLVPVPEVDGETPAVMGVSRDISDRKLLERQFAQAQKMEAIGRLAGGIAHDFNNLLTAILGYTDLLADRIGSDPALTADLDEVKKAGLRASGLTRQLLAFSRQQKSEPRVLDLNALVGDVRRMLERVIGEDVATKVACPDPVVCIKADPTQIEQLILNLAVNARDAMPKGGRLTISTAVTLIDVAFARRHDDAKPGCYAALSVSDNGCGMSQDVLAHVFEPFFTTKAEGKGTGLGLAIVFAVVKECGGFLTIDSTPGVGTTVTAYFPAAAGAASTVEAPSMPGTPKADAGTETILIVEDAPAIRTLMKRTLESRGYHVLVAESALDAPAVAESYPGTIDLLLSDVIMPDLCGPDVAQHIVGLRPEMRVLYVSGFTNFSARVDNGFNLTRKTSFLPKPFTPHALAAKVRECLTARS